MKILLDAMGGDNAPEATIKGAVKAAKELDSEIILIGKEDVIKSKLKEYYGHYCESEYEYAFIGFLEQEGWKYISGNDSTIFIYVVDNENVAGYDIIKNDQGEIIKAKEIYKGYIENINKNYVIVVDEEDKMYLFNEEENPQNNKSNETLIKESSDKFTFVNDKNETETIEVEQVY